MSIWGKIIGGGVGLALGGPLGAIIGATVGHAFDKHQAPTGEPDESTRSAAFTIAVVVLGAKMAKADGVVTKDEIHAFKEVFEIPPEELLHCLSTIAHADGKLHRNEVVYLKKVAEIFGINERTFERITAIQTGGDSADPYLILGVERNISDKALKTAYRKLVRENHPDKLIAEGLPEEFIKMANTKLAAINNAYDQICKQRGIS